MIGLENPSSTLVAIGPGDDPSPSPTPETVDPHNQLAADLLTEYDSSIDRSRLVGAGIAMCLVGKATFDDLVKLAALNI